MEQQNYKIPLVIGITGHRDILKNHTDILKNKIDEIFEHLIKKYPSTPIVFLTPLADGADRLAAEVALKDKYKNIITVSIPLPLDEKNYKETFAKGLTNHKIASDEDKKQLEKESQAEYDVLLNQVYANTNEYVPKIIPMVFDKEKYEKSSNQDKQIIRRQQYSIVGEYIAIHSNILIAMYDESENENPGGTNEIVRKKLTGEFDYFKIVAGDVTYPENGVVYAIETPKGDKQCIANYQIKKLFPLANISNTSQTIKPAPYYFEVIGLEQNEQRKNNILKDITDKLQDSCIKHAIKDSNNLFTQHHKQIECFNKKVEINIENIKKKAQEDIKKVFSDKTTELTLADRLIEKNIMIRRSAAFLSSLYQTKMKDLEKWILFFIGITTFLIVFKANHQNFQYASYLDIVYLVLIAVFFSFYQKFKGYKEKYEDYRAISEALRVQTAWNMAHINDAAALYYLSHQKNELGWIRTAVRGVNTFYIPSTEQQDFCEQQVNNYWIDEQKEYFYKNIKKYKEYDNNLDNKIKRYFTIFVLFSVIFGILGYTTDINKCSITIWNLTLIDFLKMILIDIPFTITAYLKSKQLFDGNNDIVKEYQLSFDIFSRAKLLLNKPVKDKQQVYKNLGIEALRENSFWLTTRRTKEYNTPA